MARIRQQLHFFLPRCTMSSFRYNIFASAMMMVIFIFFQHNTIPSAFSFKLQRFSSPLKKHYSSEPSENAHDGRPKAFYPWISDSGHIFKGTKPPVYGVFVVLTLDTSSYTTSTADTRTLFDRHTNHDFGFSSCNQVKRQVQNLLWIPKQVKRQVQNLLWIPKWTSSKLIAM